ADSAAVRRKPYFPGASRALQAGAGQRLAPGKADRPKLAWPVGHLEVRDHLFVWNLRADLLAVQFEAHGLAAGIDGHVQQLAFEAGPGPALALVRPAPAGQALAAPGLNRCLDRQIHFCAAPDDFAVIVLGFLESADVDVAAVGSEPGREFGDGFLGSIGRAEPGFAE